MSGCLYGWQYFGIAKNLLKSEIKNPQKAFSEWYIMASAAIC